MAKIGIVMLYLFTQKQLGLIELELKSLGLWSSQMPSAQALADPTPFACESLAFEQWLQFIFIPKMSEIIAQKTSLPTKIALAPMAEYLWQERSEMRQLIFLLNQLDECLSEPR
ncbi:YqcC family protein [Shewanella sp. Isolate11]|uniref:YqcC family protein n=1 Tax=Shewanella sp. Isolate11 TaxID=2908530 RepID=UPI001EFE0662|nr:YqcC family protein [Shewanella sp. Isolate11]MCG9696134.1 YqcC family protein [Shewanella sp. Isolate11]